MQRSSKKGKPSKIDEKYINDISSLYHHLFRGKTKDSFHNTNSNKRNGQFSSQHYSQMNHCVTRNESNPRKKINHLIKTYINKERLVTEDNCNLHNQLSSNRNLNHLSNDSLFLQKNINKHIIRTNDQQLEKQVFSATTAFKYTNRKNNNADEMLSSIGLSDKNKISRNAKNKNRTKSNDLSQTKRNLITERDNSLHLPLNKTFVFQNKSKQQKKKKNLTKTVTTNINTRNNKAKIDNSNYLKFKTYLDLKLNMIKQNHKEIINNAKERIRLYCSGESEKEKNISQQLKHKTINYNTNNKGNTINNSTNANSGYNGQQKDLLNNNIKALATKRVINDKIDFRHKNRILSHSNQFKIPHTINVNNTQLNDEIAGDELKRKDKPSIVITKHIFNTNIFHFTNHSTKKKKSRKQYDLVY